jgi:hypothetical protein
MAAAEARALAARAAAVPACEAERARPPRHSLIRMATLTVNGRPCPVRLRNLSAGGAMVDAEGAPLAAGTAVELLLDDGVAIAGEVRWCDEERVGLSFAEPFDLRRIGRARPPANAAAAGLRMVRPAYLDSENAADSPWAGRSERLTIRDVRR